MKTLSSRFGKNIKIEISGGSHEPEMVLKFWGLPNNFNWEISQLTPLLEERKGGKTFTTPRSEDDAPEITCTNPLTITVKNKNIDETAYNLSTPRPSHADLTAKLKYGDQVNMSGGGPFSGRMTVMYTVAGAIARLYLEKHGIKVSSEVISVGGKLFSEADQILKEVTDSKDSVGGVCQYQASGLPVGLGGPMFDGLESGLGKALFGIPGVKGVDFGSGVQGSSMKGSENNDQFVIDKSENEMASNTENLTALNNIKTSTNNHGGILGGISSGMPLVGKVYFKPTPSIGKKQKTINFETLEEQIIAIEGRHDPCIAIRGNAVVCATVALVLLDYFLEYQREAEPNLELSRAYLDAIDSEISNLLKNRLRESEKIGKLKQSKGLIVTDEKREKEIIDSISKAYPELPEEFIRKLYEQIFEESKKAQ